MTADDVARGAHARKIITFLDLLGDAYLRHVELADTTAAVTLSSSGHVTVQIAGNGGLDALTRFTNALGMPTATHAHTYLNDDGSLDFEEWASTGVLEDGVHVRAWVADRPQDGAS